MILHIDTNTNDPWLLILIERLLSCTDKQHGIDIIRGSQSFHQLAPLPSGKHARHVYDFTITDSSLDIHWQVKRKSGNGINPSKKRSVYAKAGFKCLKCGSLNNLTVDHVVPLVKGGTHAIANLQCLCVGCNLEKGEEIVDYRPNATRQTPSQTPPQVPQESSPQQCE